MFRIAKGAEEEFRTCLVCSDKITAMHLGMDACRACSSFFKRTKTLDRQYPCRQGDRRCLVLKEGKFSCRRCRFDKCLAIGMQYDGPMRLRKNIPNTLLERIEVEYKAFIDRRKHLEIELIESSDPKFLRIPHQKEILYKMNNNDMTTMKLFNMTVTETFCFFQRIFPSTIELTDREIIFKEFIGKFIMIDHYYRTMRVFGEIRKYVFGSAVSCIEVDTFLNKEVGDTLNDTLAKSSVSTYVDDEISVFLPIFLKSQISDKEFFALTVILMSDIEEEETLSEEVRLVLENLRHTVFRELQVYYRRNVGIDDFSVRLGNMMSLNHALQECRSLFQAYFRFYATIFDEQNIDEKMKNLFM